MNLSLIGVGAAAIAASAIAFRGDSPQTNAVAFQQPPNAQQSAIEESIRQQLIDLTPAMPDDLMRQISEQALLKGKIDLSYLIRKTELEEAGIDPTVQLELELRQVPLHRALDLLVAELGRGAQPVEWRASDRVIEIGPQSVFDRRDVVLVSYDVSAIIDTITRRYQRAYPDAIEDVTGLVMSMVEPLNWRDNGGELATLQVVGGRLFVQAPKRMQAGIEWIVAQLQEDAKASASLPPIFSPPKLEIGDVVTVSIFELQQHNVWFEVVKRIDGSGSIELPEIGSVDAAGRTTSELKTTISSLLAQKVMKNPQVTVERQVNSDGVR